MAADSAFKILLDTGVAWVFAGASGVLLELSRRQIGDEVDAGPQAQLTLFFFTFLLGQVMALYALLLAKGVVPAVSPGLAKKLSCIPLATFLLALAVQVPLMGGTGSTVLFVKVVGNGRVAGPRKGEAPRALVEDGLGARVEKDDGGNVNAAEL